MRCIDCHYDLRQLTERRCPECGREFDPNRPSTFDSPPYPVLKRWQWRVMMLIALGAMIAFIAIWLLAWIEEISNC